jgi:hypothetical protein
MGSALGNEGGKTRSVPVTWVTWTRSADIAGTGLSSKARMLLSLMRQQPCWWISHVV